VGLAGDYYKDVAALETEPPRDGLFFVGEPITPGFTAIRERAGCLNLQLLLDDGTVGLGDCISVIRSGSHDRDRPLRPEDLLVIVRDKVEPALTAVDVHSFRGLASVIDSLSVDGRPLHPGLCYGLSQAMLDAVASTQQRTMAEVLTAEYGLAPPDSPVAVFGGTSWDMPDAVDRLIAGGADILPHGGFTSVPMIGPDGERLLDFVRATAERVRRHSTGQAPRLLHLDVYGTVGRICGSNLGRILDFMRRLGEAAAPLHVRIEDPVDLGTAERSRDLMRELTAGIDAEGLPVEVVADEYCNTRQDIALWADEGAAHMIHIKLPDLGSLTNAVDAVLSCRRVGVKAYVGGTMNDTEVSGRASVHLALALRADELMAKPGAWPDVSLALTRNEMTRTLALCTARRPTASSW
jgi:methylaspartate ammonia-lyase